MLWNLADDDDLEDENHVRANVVNQIFMIINSEAPKDEYLEQIKKVALQDNIYVLLMKYIVEGFPDNLNKINNKLKPYVKLQANLSVDDGIALYGTRIIIPEQLSKGVLEKLHAAHQGIEKSKRRALETVFWPSINDDVTTTVIDCRKCQEWQPSNQKEPLMSETTPTRVFEEVSADIFAYGRYLVYIDKLSGWPCVFELTNGKTAKIMIRIFHKCFAELGVPNKLQTDCGTRSWQENLKSSLRNIKSNTLPRLRTIRLQVVMLKRW